MKILITILGILTGTYMLIDGIFVILKGKYIGPDKPGPWVNFFYKFDINVFKLGPLFIAYGLIWLIFVIGLWKNLSWAYTLGMVISILSLWYLPIGTIVSLIILIFLLISKKKLGL